jgi:hypothetical protein
VRCIENQGYADDTTQLERGSGIHYPYYGIAFLASKNT